MSRSRRTERPSSDDPLTASHLMALIEHPEHVHALTPPELLAHLLSLEPLLFALTAALARHAMAATGPPKNDRLLTVLDVATRLSLSVPAVYRRAARWPFRIRTGRYLRFSEQGLNRHLESGGAL